MRLKPDEVQAIVVAIEPFVGEMPAQLMLFGSRVDDNARGGDIDLLLCVRDDTHRTELVRVRSKMLAAITISLGERKVDLSIATQDQVQNQPFYKVALKRSIVLQSWNDFSTG